jgi:two-component system, NtrC family, response regulator HydG
MAQGKILLLEDDPENLRSLSKALERVGHTVHGFQDARQGMVFFKSNPGLDLVITDLRMPSLDGMEVLRQVKEASPEVGVLLITAFGSVESAVQAMNVGADDYLAKPVDLYELRKRVEALVEKRRLSREVEELKARLDERFGFESMIGHSPSMRDIFQQIRMVAPTRATVLLRGESGTGKELIANAIHQQSDRKRGRFLPLNCAAIPSNLIESELFGHEKGAFTGADKTHPGKFEQANGGTLFLDEIGELSLELQAKLLRVLEEKSVTRVGGTVPTPVDVRIITATHRDLGEMVRDGRFRSDLLYRLRVVEIQIPPLRNRREDIPLLAHTFLSQFNQEHGKAVHSLSEGALKVLQDWSWPGNVRELKNVMERMVIFCPAAEIAEGQLPPELKGGGEVPAPSQPSDAAQPTSATEGGEPVSLDELEKRAIMKALKETGGNKTWASKRLGIGLRTLHRKLKEYSIQDEKDSQEERSTP